MSYIEVTRARFGGYMPDNIVRVSKTTLTISPNIAERFQSGREQLDSGREKVKLGLAIDTSKLGIKLLPNSLNGFAFSAPVGSKALVVSKPSGVRRSELPTGDYQLVDERDLEFELAR